MLDTILWDLQATVLWIAKRLFFCKKFSAEILNLHSVKHINVQCKPKCIKFKFDKFLHIYLFIHVTTI